MHVCTYFKGSEQSYTFFFYLPFTDNKYLSADMSFLHWRKSGFMSTYKILFWTLKANLAFHVAFKVFLTSIRVTHAVWDIW